MKHVVKRVNEVENSTKPKKPRHNGFDIVFRDRDKRRTEYSHTNPIVVAMKIGPMLV